MTILEEIEREARSEMSACKIKYPKSHTLDPTYQYADLTIRLIKALKLAIEQRDKALNWAVDDPGMVIHELAPERNAEIEKILSEEC